MNSNANIVATFTDKYGESRHIHKNRQGLTVKRRGDTPCQIVSHKVSDYIGARVKERRIKAGYTMEELGKRAGLTTATPKQAIWAIEQNSRKCGIRFGTLYQLAIALECQITDLLPSVIAVEQMAGAGMSRQAVLSIKSSEA